MGHGVNGTAPVSSVKIGMGEMPLRIKRIQLVMEYWVFRGNVIIILLKVSTDCWEHNESNFKSFGLISNAIVESMG